MGMVERLFLLSVITLLSIAVEKRDASPQFQSFPARPGAAGAQSATVPNNQFLGSQARQIPGQQQRQQTGNPNSLSLTDRQRLALLQGNSVSQGLGGLRPAFQQQRPFTGNGIGQGNNNQFLEQPRQQQFPGQFGQTSQFAQPRPGQQFPQQRPVQQFPQSSLAQQPQQFGQSSPAQPQQFPQQRPVQQFPQSIVPRQPQQFGQQSPVQSQQLPAQQLTPNIPQQFAQEANLGQAGNGQQFTQPAGIQPQNQFLSQQQRIQSPQSHPEQFLNKLNPEQKQQFLSQFEQLTQEQQTYAYNKFLSTPAEVQQFAIKQFLSLDSQVLAVSLQEEIRKEQQQLGQTGQLPLQPFSQTQQQFPQGQQQLPQQFATNPQQSRQQQPQPSAADQLALRQQQEELQKIIDLQNSINFPNSK